MTVEIRGKKAKDMTTNCQYSWQEGDRYLIIFSCKILSPLGIPGNPAIIYLTLLCHTMILQGRYAGKKVQGVAGVDGSG